MQSVVRMIQRSRPGSSVIVRDQRWSVARVDAFDRCSIVTLEAPGRARWRVIEPFDRIVRAEAERVVIRRRRAVIEAALAAICAERPATGLWTAARASIELLPYQLEPALAVLDGAARVLLADAVGLGKTVEAGLILSELRVRGLVERALILCPPGMRASWAAELEQRFGLAAVIVDQQWLADQVATLPPGVNPWTTHGIAIASIDFVKRREVMAALAGVPIDIIIADEAHHLTPGTDRGDAVHRLALRSPWCVLLSATPHSGDVGAFDYLTRIGGHGERLLIFRRTRADAGLAAIRRERVAAVRPSAAEADLMAGVEKYARAIWKCRGATEPSAQLLAITIARRAASSPLALERTLRRRLALLSQTAAPVQFDLPWDEEADADDSGAPGLLAGPGLEDDQAERVMIETLLASIARCATAAKLEWIVRLLGRVAEPVIVFSEYRDTIDALLAVLPASRRVVAISGAVTVDERHRAVDAFNRGSADLLLATDAAGEGLNLHHRCRLVVDVEMPWSPLRLEQRIGRVDRIGQRRRVHAVRLFHAGTVEERVLDRLQLRRTRAGWLDHPPAIDERTVAASILGSSADVAPAPVRVAGVSIAGSRPEHARLVRQRRHQRPATGSGCRGAQPPHPKATRVVALHVITCVNEAGSIVADSTCAHSAEVHVSRAGSRRAILERLAASTQLRTAVRHQADRACQAINDALAPLRGAMTTRIGAIRWHLASQRPRATQRSLFDRRAEHVAGRQADALQNLDDALEHRLRTIASPARGSLALGRLVALWPLDRR